MVIGGGAHGLGVALDAALRGYRVVLLERGDFGGETSSRSTKLIHGGVRYLAQGHIGLVREASWERALLLAQAPSLVHPLRFLVPARTRFEYLRLRAGLWVYDRVGGGATATRRSSQGLDRGAAQSLWPGLREPDCVGAVTFEDAQFDDARFAVALACAAAAEGAVVLNYTEVVALRLCGERVVGVVARDLERGQEFEVTAAAIVDATGAFGVETRARGVRNVDEAGIGEPALAYSRGTHIVLGPRFVRSDHALLVPRTEDGRVVFAIPFLGHLLVGTTDVPVEGPVRAPIPTDEEIDFLLRHIRPYLQPEPTRADITSVWAGLRVLARGRSKVEGATAATGASDQAGATAGLSRECLLLETRPGLLSVIGGKWTTYRATAEEVVDRAARIAGLPSRECWTRGFRLADPDGGGETRGVRSAQPGSSGEFLCDEAFVTHAAQVEMARRVEDILARRTRILFVDAGRARSLAEPVARWLAAALGRDEAWVEAETRAMEARAETYLPG